MHPIRTGIGEYTGELLDAIFSNDQKNQYFLFYNSRQEVSKNIPDWKQENVQTTSTHWPNKLFNSSVKFLKRPRLDKLICHCDKAFQLDIFFSPNLNFTALSKKTKHVLTIHDLSFEFYPEFYTIKQRLWHKFINPKKQCEQADLILTPSENTKKDIINYYKIDSEKIKTIYPGLSKVKKNNESPVNYDDIKKKYSLPDKFILFLGTVEPRKNIIGLIEAFEKAHNLLPDNCYLVIAGAPGWKNKAIHEYAEKSKYKNYIKLIGYIDPKDKAVIYSLADIFIYPSFYEGFGFPVLEAMNAGTPVITSNRSSLPEISGNSAYLVNPNKSTEIAQAMVELIKQEKLREYFKNKGLEQAKKFNWQKTAYETIQTIQSIC
ncbi:MAG: glycosyltransferase family 1 protein [bacterium]